MAIPRRQVNIKMSQDLIEMLKAKAEREGTTFTDLVTQGCEELLGIESNRSTISISADKIDELIAEKIAPIEERLAALERKITRSLYSMER